MREKLTVCSLYHYYVHHHSVSLIFNTEGLLQEEEERRSGLLKGNKLAKQLEIRDKEAWTQHSTVLWHQTIKAIINSCSFKSPKSDEPRRVQVLDLYCLTRFESESSSREIVY